MIGPGIAPAPPAPVLVDERLDRRLRRDGFVTFPLLEPGEVARTRSVFGTLHGWDGEGFHADLTVPDPEYRRAVNGALAELLEGRVTEQFRDHQPFLYNFVCKWPGQESELYLHRDWWYVDERLGARTYVAWIALEDIRGDNGRLRVLRRSHRLDDALRGTELGPPWLEHQDVIRDRLRSVRVRAGECVVFDNGLLHCSYPNLADQPRLVAAVGMRPSNAPLVYLRRQDADTAALYEVDEAFFCSYTPNELSERPPPLPIASLVPDNQRTLADHELAALLDRGPRAMADRVARRVAGTPEHVASAAAALRRAVRDRAAARVHGPTAQPSDPHLRRDEAMRR